MLLYKCKQTNKVIKIMQTNKLKNLIISLYYATNNNIKHYYIVKSNKSIKHIKINKQTKLKQVYNNLYKNYFSLFNSNKQNLCFNYSCGQRKNCIYAQLTKAYKHITNNTYNNMLLLSYLQFYNNANYKYINNYNIKNNIYFLSTQVQKCTCKLQQN